MKTQKQRAGHFQQSVYQSLAIATAAYAAEVVRRAEAGLVDLVSPDGLSCTMVDAFIDGHAERARPGWRRARRVFQEHIWKLKRAGTFIGPGDNPFPLVRYISEDEGIVCLAARDALAKRPATAFKSPREALMYAYRQGHKFCPARRGGRRICGRELWFPLALPSKPPGQPMAHITAMEPCARVD
jgi:hypothetical protein